MLSPVTLISKISRRTHCYDTYKLSIKQDLHHLKYYKFLNILGRPWLFQCDPSGAYFAWKSTAMGKNYVNGKTFLEKRYDDKLELEDAVHTAILTLKEGFEGKKYEYFHHFLSILHSYIYTYFRANDGR